MLRPEELPYPTHQYTVAPAHAWRKIAQYIPRNAVTYCRLAEVCRDAHSIFACTYLWRHLVIHPIGTIPHYSYRVYLQGIYELSDEQVAILRRLWVLLEDERLWQGTLESSDFTERIDSSLIGDNLMLSLPYSIYMGLYHTHMPRTRVRVEDLRGLPAWQNRDFAHLAFKLCGSLLSYAPQYSNEFLMAKAAVDSPVVPQMWLIDSALRANRQIVLPIVASQDCFQLANPAMWDDEEVVRAAVGHSWRAYLVTSARLRDQYDITHLAVSKSGRALEAAPRVFRNNPDVVATAVSNYGLALEHASASLRDSERIVALAVANNGMALEFASNRLCDVKEVVLAATQVDGHALRYASTRLRGDREVVLAAVKERGSAFQFATKALQRDEHLVEEAIAINKRAIEFASPTIQSRLRKRRALEAEGDEKSAEDVKEQSEDRTETEEGASR